MKLNIPLHKRLHQLFCRHKTIGWASQTEGINNKKGCEYVTFECLDCGLNVGKWFEDNEWERIDFPDEYTLN